MKETFLGYYKPNADEFKDLWKNCIFILDANVLLNLYHYSHEAIDSFMKILEALSDRIWITHQAAFEYQDNRLQEIVRQEKVYKLILEKLDSTQRDLEDIVGRGHLSIKVEELFKKVTDTFAYVKNDLLEHQRSHPDLLNDDSIRERITCILCGRVGVPYVNARLKEIYTSGEDRYNNKIPPGYKDKCKDEKKKFGDELIEAKYGDLIQWNQMIDKAKECKKPIIFITDDIKEDWWWQSNGKTIGPRPELITEMKNKTSVRFYMYTPDNFMKYANEYLSLKIKQKIIDEVREFEESKNSWKNEVIKALNHLEGEADLSEIYEYVEDKTTKKLPKTWQSQVRKTLYSYSSDCEIYLGKEDLFTRVGKGRWALRKNSD